MHEPLDHLGKKTPPDPRALNKLVQLHLVALRQTGEFYHNSNCIVGCASNLHRVLDFLSPIIHQSESTTLFSAVIRNMLPRDVCHSLRPFTHPACYPATAAHRSRSVPPPLSQRPAIVPKPCWTPHRSPVGPVSLCFLKLFLAGHCWNLRVASMTATGPYRSVAPSKPLVFPEGSAAPHRGAPPQTGFEQGMTQDGPQSLVNEK